MSGDLENTISAIFCSRILTHLKHDDNVLVAVRGNSLRSIIMQLDNLSKEEVYNLELVTGIPIIYDVDMVGNATNKMILN